MSAMKGYYDKDNDRMVWVDVPDGDVRPTNSGGNTGANVRKFMREQKLPVNVESVERMTREVSRTEGQNDALAKAAKEQGFDKTITRSGHDAVKLAKANVAREMKNRKQS